MPLDLDAPRPPKKRFSVTMLLVVVAVFLLAEVVYQVVRDDTARGIVGSIIETYRWDRARGLVVDASTGRGILGATVRLTTIGWDGNPLNVLSFSPGRSYLTAHTDSSGYFEISYRDRGRSHVDITREGYAAIEEVPLTPGVPIFPTSRFDGRSPWVEATRFIVSLAEVRAVEVDFDTLGLGEGGGPPEVRFERPVVDSGFVVVRALGGAGLRRVTSAYREPIDPVAVECMAPEDGYVAVDSVAATTEIATWFLLRRDGRRYARIQVRPRSLLQTFRNEQYAALGVTLWRNKDGGRQLCPPPGSHVRANRRARPASVVESVSELLGDSTAAGD